MFSFQMLADPPYICNNTHCTCSSTVAPANLFLMYNLHSITKPETFDEAPLNNCGFATSKLAIFSDSSLTCLPATASLSSKACI